MLKIINTNNSVLENIIDIFEINSSIEERFFFKTHCLDKHLENSYVEEKKSKKDYSEIISDILLIYGWIAAALYIYLVYYRLPYFASVCVLSVVAVLLMILKYRKNTEISKLIIEHLQVLIITTFLNVKVISLVFYYNAEENRDNDAEVVRLIIYQWISTNLLIMYKLDGRLWVNISFFLFNLITILIVQFKSGNHFYYLDGLSCLPMSILCYTIKKNSDVRLRKIFVEKFINKKLLLYTTVFIDGLNGFYLNVKSDGNILCGSKMLNYIKTLKYDKINNSEAKISIEVNESLLILQNSESLTPSEFLHSLKQYDRQLLEPNPSYENPRPHLNEESLNSKINSLQNEEVAQNYNFIKLGKFYNKYNFYDIYYRKIIITKTNVIYDLMFFDVTELTVSVLNYEDQMNKNQIIIGKLVHEFKTPLNSAIALVEKIEENSQNKEMTKDSLKKIHSLSSYAIYLINDIIQYSNKNKNTELKVEITKVSLKQVVIFSYDILNSLISCNNSKSKSIATEMEFEEDLYSLNIDADETRLKQIILNFISNAVKFTKAGLIKLKCFKIPEQQMVSISIADSGLGISDSNQKLLFNEFFMVGETYSANPLGSGLGLSISKKFAEKMNMQLTFQSTLGLGSEFNIEIPTHYSQNLSGRSSSFCGQHMSNKEESSRRGEYDGQAVTARIKRKQGISDGAESSLFNREYNSSRDICSISKSKNIMIECAGKIVLKVIKLDNSSYDGKANVEVLEEETNNLNELLSPGINGSALKSPKIWDVSPSKDYLWATKVGLKQSTSLQTSTKAKILVVDDSKYILEAIVNLVKRILKQAESDIEVVTGTDGVDILRYIVQDQAEENKIKCIITDENMEYLEGSSAIRILRKLEGDKKIKNVKIISATSQEDYESIKYIMDAGADLVMSKPLSKTELIKAFQNLQVIVKQNAFLN